MLKIKKKKAYSPKELIDICLNLGYIKHSDKKKTKLDITAKCLQGLNKFHVQSTIIFAENKDYTVFELMLGQFVNDVLSQIKQENNDVLGDNLMDFFRLFPRVQHMDNIISEVQGMTDEQVQKEINKIRSGKQKPMKEIHPNYIG